jgi:hypothetical protein
VGTLAERLRAMAGRPAAPAPAPAAPSVRPQLSRSLHARLAAIPNAPSVADVTEGPRDSGDFRRVSALPRRDLDLSAANVDAYTERFRRPGGTMRLLEIQAAALKDAEAAGGLVGFIGLGHGKTLLSLLLFTAWRSRVGVLLLKASLVDKLLKLEYPELAKHWRLPNLAPHHRAPFYPDASGVLHVISYNQLSSPRTPTLLEDINPDAIVGDEGHTLAGNSSRGKRFRRYVRKRGAPVKQGIVSGSLTKKSPKDYFTLAVSALGDGAPAPKDWREQQAWAMAIENENEGAAPGVLATLCEPGESLQGAWRRRLVQTPGVVATVEGSAAVPLTIHNASVPVPDVVRDALAKLRKDWTLPDGAPLSEATQYYAAIRQLSCGFYYRRIYPRGESKALIDEWNDCRRAYFKDLRARLAASIPGQDSPQLCWEAAAEGRWRCDTWEAWADIKPEVQPDTETVWLSRYALDAAIAWARAAPGIVWLESEAMIVATEAARETGLPCYQDKDDAEAIRREKGDRSIFLSINSHREGHNLQCFTRQLFVTPLPSNDWLGQAIGRSLRKGQTRPVHVDFFLHTPEILKAVSDARRRAQYVENTTGSWQALLHASYDFDPDADPT